jgi:hypothetical protein
MYFGTIATISFKGTRSLRNDHIKSLSENQADSKRQGLTERQPIPNHVELTRGGPLIWEEPLRVAHRP